MQDSLILPSKLQVQHQRFTDLDKHITYTQNDLQVSIAKAYGLLRNTKKFNYSQQATNWFLKKNDIKLLNSSRSQSITHNSLRSLHAADCSCNHCNLSQARKALFANLNADIKEVSLLSESITSSNSINQDAIDDHPLARAQFLDEEIEQLSNSMPSINESESQSEFKMSFQEIQDNKDNLLLSIPDDYKETFVRYSKKQLYEIQDHVIKGGALFYQLQHNANILELEKEKLDKATEPEKDEARKQYLRSIVDLMWYFYHESSRKKEAYEEGMFVLSDPKGIVYNYLLNYAKEVNPKIKGTLEDPALLHADNPFAYPRATSHLKDINARAYAIDIRFDKNESSKANLPAQKRTFFFEYDGKNLYGKLENYGLAPSEAIYHLGELGVAQLRKIPLTKKYLGGDDQESYRKERVPADFIRKIKPWLKTKPLSDEEKEKIFNHIKKIGYKALFESDIIALGESLIDEEEKDQDHFPSRRGHETILFHELCSALYYKLYTEKNAHAPEVKKLFDGLNQIQLVLKELKKPCDLNEQQQKVNVLEEIMQQKLSTEQIKVLRNSNTSIFDYVMSIHSFLQKALSQVNLQDKVKNLTPRYGIFEVVHEQMNRVQA